MNKQTEDDIDGSGNLLIPKSGNQKKKIAKINNDNWQNIRWISLFALLALLIASIYFFCRYFMVALIHFCHYLVVTFTPDFEEK